MKKKTNIIRYLMALVVLATTPLAAFSQVEITQMPEYETVQEMVDYAKTLQRRPYRNGATGPYAFDCSGYTLFCFKKLGISLNRTSAQQAEQGKKIRNRKYLKPGDLVCFNGSKIGREVGHVGIVVETDGKEFSFIHASSSVGITISKSDVKYYDDRYLYGRRITADKRLRRAIKKLAEAKEDSVATANGQPVKEPSVTEEEIEKRKNHKRRNNKSDKVEADKKDDKKTPATKEEPATPVKPTDNTPAKNDSTKADPSSVVNDAFGNQYHTVEKGDTLYNIAKRAGCTVQQLQEWNNLKDNSLSIGQKLRVKK